MRLATIHHHSIEKSAIIIDDCVLPIEAINQRFLKNWYTDLFRLINSGQLMELRIWIKQRKNEILEKCGGKVQGLSTVEFAPLYRHPRKIWGIGLNYAEHASDLSERTPKGIPGSFMKPDTTIIGHGDPIHIPLQSEKTTGEAELGVVIGKKCKNVSPEEWLTVVAGFTNIIDMTAEDILRRNPRYLTLSKSFDTFLSFGPNLITPDEIEDVMDLTVSTVLNGEIMVQNAVSNMTFPPDFLVSFHSKVMTLLPGDIILTGTPGAVHLHDGDRITCQIDGFHPLENEVVDLKLGKRDNNSL